MSDQRCRCKGCQGPPICKCCNSMPDFDPDDVDMTGEQASSDPVAEIVKRFQDQGGGMERVQRAMQDLLVDTLKPERKPISAAEFARSVQESLQMRVLASAFSAENHRLQSLNAALVQEAREQRERADALEAENDRLREALIETFEYDDGTFMQTRRRCRVCSWSESYDFPVGHEAHCALAAAQPPAAGTEGVEA